MTRMQDRELDQFFDAWQEKPTLPLEVSRAKYDIPYPRSWEVMAMETPTFSVPIAEFTEWHEAQAFAVKQARWAVKVKRQLPRRHYLGYNPFDGWGSVAVDQIGRDGKATKLYRDHRGKYVPMDLIRSEGLVENARRNIREQEARQIRVLAQIAAGRGNNA